MSPTRATLKTLVQCRPIWFWHFWGVIICLVVLAESLGSANAYGGIILGLLVLPLWAGIISTTLYKDFLTKQFSICAPRHTLVWRRILFTIAIVVAGVCALVSLTTPADTPGVVAATVWLTFILCLVTFMVAVFMVLLTANTSFLPAVITLLMIVIFNDNLDQYVRITIGGALLANTMVTTVICSAVLYAAWRELGSGNFARRMCGREFLGLQSTFNRSRTAAYQAERKLSLMQRSPGRFVKFLDRFFLARMRALTGQPTLKSLWGTIYIQTSKWAPASVYNFIALFVLLVALSLLLGYYHPKRLDPGISGANLILFLICAISADYGVNPFAGLLLNISRKNRFRSLVFSALAQWLAVAVIAAMLTAVSIAAGRFLDEVTIFGSTYPYAPIHPKAFFVFAPMIPFYFLSQVLFPRFHVITLIVVITTGVIVFFASGQRIVEMSFLGILLLQLLSWLPFVVFIRRFCYSKDLKLNGQ